MEIVHSGEVGGLRYVYSDRQSLGKIRSEENVLWSFAPHDISMVLALIDEQPIEVTAQGAAFVDPAIADVATVQLMFAGGVRADIRVSWLHFRKVQQIVALCERGTIVFEDSQPEWNRKLSIHEHVVELENGVPVPRRGPVRYIDAPYEEPLRNECVHFLQCIAEGKGPLTDGREGKAVLRVLQQASSAMAGHARSPEKVDE